MIAVPGEKSRKLRCWSAVALPRPRHEMPGIPVGSRYAGRNPCHLVDQPNHLMAVGLTEPVELAVAPGNERRRKMTATCMPVADVQVDSRGQM